MNQYSRTEPSAAVLGARGVPIEEAGTVREVADRVRLGKAYLKIVETPWGVEFYVVDAGAIA